MRDVTPSRHETGARSAASRLLAALLLCGGLLLTGAAPAGAATLNWADPAVVWPNGSLGPHTFTLSNGVMVTITVAATAGGSFTFSSPAEDCASGCVNSPQLFGSAHNLGVVFDPTAGGASTVNVTLSFSTPVTDLMFEISDIDFSVGAAGTHRRDQVVITSNAGNPALSFKTVGTHTFSIAGNTATANCTVSPEPNCNPATDTTAAPSDAGTVVVDFTGLSVSTVTIAYNEAGSGTNPSGRGIGLLANLSLTPVELMNFTIE
ncbi:MAG TPA: hypothetical protein VF789_10710 [Thermoanaerobaculia bacterium]